MVLEKNDFNRIEKMFEKFEKNIQQVVQESEQRVTFKITREVSDLAEINRAVIDKVSKIDELEKRIRRLEVKTGIK
jgi:tetrahydromethanopterin S-methyltransferase subunit G